MPPRVVIVGGGFGGLFAAKALSGAPVEATLVDRHNHHLFQPLLYQVATAGLSPGDIAAPLRWILRRQRNVRVLLGEVTRIDLTARRVTLADCAAFEYDFLILATGVTNAYFGHEEWQAWAPALKTLDDALKIRSEMLLAYERAEREIDPAARARLLTFVLVGGGPTGVELAGAIAEIARQTLADEFRTIETAQARIVLVEAGPTILPAFPETLRDAARRSLRRLGVEVLENARVTGIDGGGVWLGDTRLASETVIWAAGVEASPLGRSLGVPVDRVGRVIVQPDLSIPDHPEVFVIGDLAACTGDDGRPLPGVCQVAMQQGTHAARGIVRSIEQQPRRPFRYKDFGNMATIGRAAAIADLGRLRLSGFVAWLMWLFIHILWLIGFRNRLSVMLQWAVAYLTYQRSVRLITGQDSKQPQGPEPQC
jgi:NADH:ubiquinone reductase (H+-translocating)